MSTYNSRGITVKKIIIILLFFMNTLIYSFEYVEIYNDTRPDKIDFNFAFDKYVLIDKDIYVFAKKQLNYREMPMVNPKVLGKLKPHQTLKTTALVDNDGVKWYEVVTKDDNLAYIRSDLVIKREYNFKNAVEKAEKLNKFIEKYKGNIKIISKYVPLIEEKVNKKDKFGNRESQSVRVYIDEKKTSYINLPDRSLFTIIDETDNDYIILTSAYGEDTLYYMPKKKNKRYIKESNIEEIINKFIFVSKHSQNQITYERNVETNRYNILTTGYVTTGRDSEHGYSTPSGEFLVAITKPVMKYTSDIEKDKIIGEALYAIRFSGGAYLHGIPYTYEPVKGIKERKKHTASKLGTYPLSHKCVRNQDDMVKFLYEWIGVSSVNKAGHRTPLEPVIVIVE